MGWIHYLLQSYLKPFFSISQTQLLANVTLRSLEARFEDQQQPTLTEAEQRKSYELQKISEMRSLVAKYTSGFKPPKLLQPSSLTLPDCVVLVTGTTGVVGANLLECLLCAPQINRIFLLNCTSLELRLYAGTSPINFPGTVPQSDRARLRKGRVFGRYSPADTWNEVSPALLMQTQKFILF